MPTNIFAVLTFFNGWSPPVILRQALSLTVFCDAKLHTSSYSQCHTQANKSTDNPTRQQIVAKEWLKRTLTFSDWCVLVCFEIISEHEGFWVSVTTKLRLLPYRLLSPLHRIGFKCWQGCHHCRQMKGLKAPSARIRKFVKMQIFFYEYGLRPHVSSVFSGRIRKFLKTLSRVEIFLSDTSKCTCGRSYPQICEYAYVIFLGPVFTSSIINKHGVQQGCIFFVNCSDF